MVVESSIFDRQVLVPERYRQQAVERGWPGGLLERALQLRVERSHIEFWLSDERERVDDIKKYLDRLERLMHGTLRVREATWDDDSELADLYADSPEDIGEWQVTVERSPYSFAQFRLQEHVNIQVLEDRGVLLAVAAHSGRNTIIDGQRITAHIATAWRTRQGFRGQGYSNLLRTRGGPGCAWFGVVNYWYFRSQNFGAFNWLQAIAADMIDSIPARDGDVPGLPVTVHHFPARPFDGDASGIRLVAEQDVDRCVALINRTHHGLDLFRPYSQEFLHMRLDDPFWGPKPPFWAAVYGWPDYYVVEEEGRVVACAGLWDRGRHIREVWRHRESGEERVLETTALMDFGFEEGREDAVARLLGYFIEKTQELGRGAMMAAIEQLPTLVDRMTPFEPAPEVRSMGVSMPDEREMQVDVKIRRPYTDLAYW